MGVLLADYGAPPEYNEWTYESFREFFSHLIDMGIIPSWLKALETGTILDDADRPACAERSDSPRLIDAWLRPYDGLRLLHDRRDVVVGGTQWRRVAQRHGALAEGLQVLGDLVAQVVGLHDVAEPQQGVRPR